MLGVNSYAQDYIDDVRAQVKRQVAAYRGLANASRKAAGSSKASVDSALKKFEPIYFNGLVLNLEGYFVHRLRGVEGKDGNPLNEVRLLSTSLMANGGVFASEKSIKWKPEASVLGYKEGDPIQLSETDFAQLSEAFFSELEAKFAG